MLKLAFPLEGLNSSGGLRIITLLINHLSDNGYDVDVIIPDYSSTPFYRLSPKVNLIVIKTKKGFLARFSYILKLIELSSREQYSISFATGFKTPLYIFISKIYNLSDTRLIYLLQHYEASSQVKIISNHSPLKKLTLYMLAKIGYRLPLKKIAVSNWIKNKVALRNIDVIPNGIDLNYYKPSTTFPVIQRDIIVGIIGTNKVIKGYSFALQAISLLDQRSLSKIKLLILTQEKIALPDFVAFEIVNAKSDEEIAAFYQRCSFFIFASFEEGFGLPPLEAMACGTPLICSRCGGVDEFITASNALTFDTGNSIQLVNHMNQLIQNDKLRDQLAEHGLATAREFSVENMLSQYLNIVKQLSHQAKLT